MLTGLVSLAASMDERKERTGKSGFRAYEAIISSGRACFI
jgi:hypothetical protein